MTNLVVGASGATGQLLVAQLLSRGERVKVIVRPTSHLPAELEQHENVSIVRAGLLELDDAELAAHVSGCRAIASCLGHNMNFKGIYGQPRRLVTDAVRRLCRAVSANNPTTAVRFVLMNTNGNRNRDLAEPISLPQKCVIGLLRLLLPPHVDNEQAAEYLRTEIGHGPGDIEWVAVRPDNLTNEPSVSAYETHPSPIRSAIFAAGHTSRINVAHFMAELITNDEIWQRWQGRMPVIYNREQVQ